MSASSLDSVLTQIEDAHNGDHPFPVISRPTLDIRKASLREVVDQIPNTIVGSLAEWSKGFTTKTSHTKQPDALPNVEITIQRGQLPCLNPPADDDPAVPVEEFVMPPEVVVELRGKSGAYKRYVDSFVQRVPSQTMGANLRGNTGLDTGEEGKVKDVFDAFFQPLLIFAQIYVIRRILMAKFKWDKTVTRIGRVIRMAYGQETLIGEGGSCKPDRGLFDVYGRFFTVEAKPPVFDCGILDVFDGVFSWTYRTWVADVERRFRDAGSATQAQHSCLVQVCVITCASHLDG